MLQKAIDKIRDEMVAKQDNGYVQAVGNMLLGYLEHNPAVADKIVVTGKTIAGSYSAMESEARRKKSGNCAVLADQEGFAVVLKYFGINDVFGAEPAQRETITVTTSAPQSPAAAIDFDVRLDDLLGG